MITVILVAHILLALALVGVILLQRSEGGALGIGGGGGGGGSMMSSRSAGQSADPGHGHPRDLFHRNQHHAGHPFGRGPRTVVGDRDRTPGAGIGSTVAGAGRAFRPPVAVNADHVRPIRHIAPLSLGGAASLLYVCGP